MDKKINFRRVIHALVHDSIDDSKYVASIDYHLFILQWRSNHFFGNSYDLRKVIEVVPVDELGGNMKSFLDKLSIKKLKVLQDLCEKLRYLNNRALPNPIFDIVLTLFVVVIFTFITIDEFFIYC